MTNFRFLTLCLLFAPISLPVRAEMVRKNVVAPSTEFSGSISLDDFYRIKRVFLFPGLDDLNGVVASQLDKKLTEVFSQNPRFELVKNEAVVKALSADDRAYGKFAQSGAIHREAIKAAKVDATVIVRSHTAAGKTSLALEWRDLEGKLLLSQEGSLPSMSPIEAQEDVLEDLFEECVRQIPFVGSVTGRKGQTLTVDLGDEQVREGDRLDFGRIINMQRHPLLHTLVKADFVRVGSARVVNQDKILSFAEVIEEVPSELIGVGSKIIGIKRAEKKSLTEPRPVPMYSRRDELRQRNDPQRARLDDEKYARQKKSDQELFGDLGGKNPGDEETLSGDFERPKARLGNVGAGLALGNLSHNNTRRAITTEASSNGIGAFVGGELWVTRDWILGGEYHHQSANLSGTRAGTSASLGSSSWSRLDVFASYRYLPGETLDGTVLLFGGGYQSKNSNIPENATYNTAKKSYTGLLLRFDADIFLDLNNRFLVGVSLVPFSSADGLSSVTTLGFRFGWSINLTDVLWGRICFDYDSVTGTSGSGDDTRTDRRYAILPAIYFYF